MNQSSDSPFLSYYATLGTIPTRQVVSTGVYSKVRRELYLRLGLSPALLRSASVIEFGPGSGENIASLSRFAPTSITLVDGSETALLMSAEKLSQASYAGKVVQVLSAIDEVDLTEEFDAAFCEGVLPFQASPCKSLQKILASVRPDGLLVITCADPVSILSESLRRLISYAAVNAGIVTDSPSAIADFFQTDLSYLPAMTRSHADWVLDQILQPWIGQPFSASEAMRCVGDSARVIGSTPTLIQDWRWFKELSSPSDSNAAQADWFDGMCHNLLDERVSPDFTPQDNTDLINASNAIYRLAQRRDCIQTDTLRRQLLRIIDLEYLSPQTRSSILSALTFITSGETNALKDFRSWWGRGQQYLSFCRE